MLTIANTTFAQKSFIQDIRIGGILATVGSTSFSKSEKPFVVGQNLFVVVTVKTKRTFHNIFYGFADNSFNSLNGYFLKNNWDTYILYSKNMSTGKSYIGWGVEKMQKIADVKFFLFSEIGTNFTGREFLTLGVLTNISWSLKK